MWEMQHAYESRIFLIIFLLIATHINAAEIIFAKQYLSEGVGALIELSDGGYIGSAWDHNYPVLTSAAQSAQCQQG